MFFKGLPLITEIISGGHGRINQYVMGLIYRNLKT